MKKVTFPFSKFVSLMPFVLVITLFASCKVVVEDYAGASIFGRNTSGVYDEEDKYNINLLECAAHLKPVKVEEVPGTGGYFFTALSGEYTNANGWTFQSAVKELSPSSLHVKTYDVQGTATRVGCEIHMEYTPGPNDPTNVHWIQVVQTNHSLRPPAGHDNSATYVDRPGTATTPYYDNGYAANTTDLYDFPGRLDAGAPHTWEATTFLVEGPAIGAGAGNVLIYTPGFRWGWVNECKLIIDFPDWFFFLQYPLALQVERPWKPGGTLALNINSNEGFTLAKGEEQIPVLLEEGSINLNIGKTMDAGGFYSLSLQEGFIKFGSYQTGTTTVRGGIGQIEKASGYLHEESGEASLQMELKVPGPDGPIRMLWTSHAQLDKESQSLIIDTGTQGVEMSKSQ